MRTFVRAGPGTALRLGSPAAAGTPFVADASNVHAGDRFEYRWDRRH
jgi:hypothetical protein